MGWWTNSARMCNAIRAHGPRSVRHLAERIGLSTSRVPRHLQASKRRDGYPEASLWDTAGGRTGLLRLVVATLCVCGLTRGVGAETRSAFFGRLPLEAHGGGAPNALRRVMHTLERRILDTATTWEQEGRAPGARRPVIGAVDETFLQRMMLVFMALASGDRWLAEVAGDRREDTWSDRAHDRLTP